MEESERRQLIIEYLKGKATLKQEIFKNTSDAFGLLKNVLQNMVKECNVELEGETKEPMFAYRERGPFEAELKIAGDLLIFSMHSNIFNFDREHPIRQTEYIKANGDNTFSGIINIYNFLADSFKYNRDGDLGYLIARLFINQENRLYVEGKRQKDDEKITGFAADVISEEQLRKIVYNALVYCLQFDLLAPPYDQIKIVSVEQMKEHINHSNVRTGKRLGFKFNSDDI